MPALPAGDGRGQESSAVAGGPPRAASARSDAAAGRSIAPSIPMATVTAVTANSIAPGRLSPTDHDRATSPASACSSITPARRSS